MSMNKRTKGQNCEFCVLLKFLHSLNFWSISPKKWSYCSKANIISLHRVYIYNFTLINRPGVAGADLQTAS